MVGVVGGEGEQRCPEIEEVRAAMAGGAFEPRDENEVGSRTPPYRAIPHAVICQTGWIFLIRYGIEIFA
jgi:hypothetical protein